MQDASVFTFNGSMQTRVHVSCSEIVSHCFCFAQLTADKRRRRCTPSQQGRRTRRQSRCRSSRGGRGHIHGVGDHGIDIIFCQSTLLFWPFLELTGRHPSQSTVRHTGVAGGLVDAANDLRRLCFEVIESMQRRFCQLLLAWLWSRHADVENENGQVRNRLPNSRWHFEMKCRQRKELEATDNGTHNKRRGRRKPVQG